MPTPREDSSARRSRQYVTGSSAGRSVSQSLTSQPANSAASRRAVRRRPGMTRAASANGDHGPVSARASSRPSCTVSPMLILIASRDAPGSRGARALRRRAARAAASIAIDSGRPSSAMLQAIAAGGVRYSTGSRVGWRRRSGATEEL